MAQRSRKRPFRLDHGRLKIACTNAWFAFILAGTGAIAFSKTTSLTSIVVGGILIALGFMMFVLAVIDFSGVGHGGAQ